MYGCSHKTGGGIAMCDENAIHVGVFYFDPLAQLVGAGCQPLVLCAPKSQVRILSEALPS